jgi:hypothetical protein
MRALNVAMAVVLTVIMKGIAFAMPKGGSPPLPVSQDGARFTLLDVVLIVGVIVGLNVIIVLWIWARKSPNQVPNSNRGNTPRGS